MNRIEAKEWVQKVKEWNAYLPATCPFCDTKLSIVHLDNPYDVVYCWKHGFLKIDSLNGFLEVHSTLESALGEEGYEFHLFRIKKRDFL
jgi:hypothetical protein